MPDRPPPTLPPWEDLPEPNPDYNLADLDNIGLAELWVVMGTSGPIQQEDVGSPGGAIGSAEDEQGASDAATMGAGGTGGAAQ